MFRCRVLLGETITCITIASLAFYDMLRTKSCYLPAREDDRGDRKRRHAPRELAAAGQESARRASPPSFFCGALPLLTERRPSAEHPINLSSRVPCHA